MRSYPLPGLFLATRHAVSIMTSNPVILRPTATGISLLFLSLKHSSSVREGRVTGVRGWPQCWEVSLPLSASPSQRRRPRERQSSWASHLLLQTPRWVQRRSRKSQHHDLEHAVLWSLKECMKLQIPRPCAQGIMIQWVKGGPWVMLMQLGGSSNFEEHWFGLETLERVRIRIVTWHFKSGSALEPWFPTPEKCPAPNHVTKVFYSNSVPVKGAAGQSGAPGTWETFWRLPGILGKRGWERGTQSPLFGMTWPNIYADWMLL